MALLDDAARKSLLLKARRAIAKAIGVTRWKTNTHPNPHPEDFMAGALVTSGEASCEGVLVIPSLGCPSSKSSSAARYLRRSQIQDFHR